MPFVSCEIPLEYSDVPFCKGCSEVDGAMILDLVAEIRGFLFDDVRLEGMAQRLTRARRCDEVEEENNIPSIGRVLLKKPSTGVHT